MNLYIIGNGFDLNHGMHTSYKDYRDFLYKKDPGILYKYEGKNYLSASGLDDKWSDLEEGLSIMYDECMAEMEAYPDLTSEHTPGWDDTFLNIRSELSFLDKFTHAYFYEWLMCLNPVNSIRTDIDKNSVFVTFNYTKTLEDQYSVPSSRILHIHGCIDDLSTIQFGTPENDPDVIYERLEKNYSKDDFSNLVYEPAIREIVSLAQGSYKNFSNNIKILNGFLDSMMPIDKVIIMGHSYNGIDSPYYEEVFLPRYHNAPWTIYVHNLYEDKKARDFCYDNNLHAYFLPW